jgi:hypothetical protein
MTSKYLNLMKLKTLFLTCLCFSILGCAQKEKSKTTEKTQRFDSSKVILENKNDTVEQELIENPISEKSKKTIGYVKICDFKISYKDTFTTKNTIEYRLDNGIIYIKELYPNKRLKSESYWVNNITPVYQIKQYNENGGIKKIIDKSIGKYDLCYILRKIKTNPVLKNKIVNISISDKSDYISHKSWYVTYDHSEYLTGSSAEGIYYDSQTGSSYPGGYSISDQPANLTEPTINQLPTYTGGIEKITRDLINNLNIPDDSIYNSRVIVSFNVDPYGVVGNFQTQGASKFLNSEVLRIIKKMPNWKPAKDKTTSGACNVEGEDYGKYTFAIFVYFRRFE